MEDSLDTAKNLFEFDNHQEVIRIENKDLGVVGFIAIHSKRGHSPSLGATRVWNYNSEEEALRDALRLSRLMSHKSVFADLAYGGAKAALKVSSTDFDREKLFSWYAGKLNELGGKFVTGSDVGVEDDDVGLMREYTPYVIGDSVPAAYYTALGVLNGIEVVLKDIYGISDITKRSFAIQGLGKTGLDLLKLLFDGGAEKIIISDIDPKKTEAALNMFPQAIMVKPNHIYAQKVDVFCPCALNYSINAATEPLLRCSAIVGSANNQMEHLEIELAVHRRAILYAVDYIVNNGGLISVVDQFENGQHDDQRIQQKLLITKNKLMDVLAMSKKELISPAVVADRYVAKILDKQTII